MNTTNEAQPVVTPAITTKIRWLYGLGAAAFGVKDNGFSYFLMIYYNQVLGMTASLAGLAILIAMIFDAISDPLVGWWSDNTHSRWGRRHPFMYSAAIPVAVVYYLLWNPPLDFLAQFEYGLFFYLTVAAIVIRFLITLYEIPSTGMVAELTEDYDERTRLLSYRYMFGWYGGLFMAVLAWGVFMKDTPEYANGVLNPAGYFGYSLVGSILIVIAILWSSIGLHKFIPYLKQPPERQSFNPMQIVKDLKVTLANRNFLSLFMAGLFAAIGAGVATNFDAYITNYFWGFNSSDIRWLNVSLFISASMAAILSPIITRRFDKKASALGIYGISIFYGAMPVLLRLFGLFPGNDSPYLLPVMIFHYITNVTLIVMFGIIQSSMLADIVEHSQMKTGRREEGLFFAARTFAAKATSGVGAFIAGITLDLIQFPIGATPGQVSEDVLFRLGVIFGPTLMVFYLLALVCISFYQITREGHGDRIETLQERQEESA
ncbi:MAG: MFS transporter [Desulfobacterales bacterium]